MTSTAKKNWKRMFSGPTSGLLETDPEFAQFFADFAFDEVPLQDDLDDRSRMMAILAALIGSQSTETFEAMLPAALGLGVTPVEAREIVYQAAAYLGIGRTLPFLQAANRVFTAQGISLPLPAQSTTSPDIRLEQGEQVQVDIFGEQMREFSKSGPEESRHINRWLSSNCFGDYYTRTGLDNRQREMITFCLLAAQGGCEPQLISHAATNIRIGNRRPFLVKVISQCLPYIGYPRSLNALQCLRKAVEQ